MLRNYVFAYLDRIIICSKDADTHLGRLAAVFLRLRDAGLKTKLSKSTFLKADICVLGTTVNDDGSHTMDHKMSTVKCWAFFSMVVLLL